MQVVQKSKRDQAQKNTCSPMGYFSEKLYPMYKPITYKKKCIHTRHSALSSVSHLYFFPKPPNPSGKISSFLSHQFTHEEIHNHSNSSFSIPALSSVMKSSFLFLLGPTYLESLISAPFVDASHRSEHRKISREQYNSIAT